MVSSTHGKVQGVGDTAFNSSPRARETSGSLGLLDQPF